MTRRGVTEACWLTGCAFAVLLAACGTSEPAKGCTDPTAVNFDPAAAEDDGSCLSFQGPRSPDFEADGVWVQDANNGYAGNGFADMPTGTGFMPTHGIRYLRFATGTSNNWYTGACAVFQDGVKLERSAQLVFDYAAQGVGNVTVEMLFTGNGTVTIWSKVFSSSFDVQQVNETVALPSLPDAGRLTIKVSSTGGQNSAGSVQIDNLRVQ